MQAVRSPLHSDRVVASDACATLSAMRAFYSVHTVGVLWVHSTSFVPGDPDLWLLTLTFKLVPVKDETRLPCEFGANPFSSSCHPLSNTSAKNLTRFDDFAHLAHKWSPTITVNSGLSGTKFTKILHNVERTSALLMHPSAFPSCHPFRNASPKKEGVWTISANFAKPISDWTSTSTCLSPWKFLWRSVL